MKITRIHIDGFGVWHDQGWEDLSGGVNVFYGPNEAGKTTLMSFIRSILFGFERRSHARRYEPANGGDYGGWIEVESGGRPVRILRRGGRHVRGAVEIRMPDGDCQADAERVLEEILGGTTRTLYHNVFAFGLEELEHFRTLEESEVASHISGAGMGVGAKRWSRVWRDLEERRSSLYLPRGQNASLNQTLRELEGIREELDRTADEPEAYFGALEARDRLDAEIVSLEEETRALKVRIGHYRKVHEAEPYRNRRSELEGELGELERIDSFPEGGVTRLNFLFDERRGTEAELIGSREEIARIRAERQVLTRQYAPQDLIRRSRAVDSLRLLLPRRDASGEVVAGLTARRDERVLESERLAARKAATGPPSPTAMIVLAGLIATAATGLIYSGYPVARWIAPASLVALAVWYYGRVRASGRVDADIAACEARLAEAGARLEQALGEGRLVAASIGQLAGRSDFSHVDLETEAARVGDLAGIAERLRSIDERLESEDRQCERLREKIERTDQRIQDLLGEGGASSESEFFRRSESFRKRSELMAALSRTPSGDVDPLPAGQKPLDAATWPEAVAGHDRASARLREARTEAGRLEERLTTLSRSEQRSRSRLRQESVMARIDEASGKWAVLTLCRTLLSDTRRIYETERQPEVLRYASEVFSRMTGGNWIRVISPLDSGILVESAAGERVSPENLSRGTGEQLYLAMRLALVREYSGHVRPLPVVLDDIFVNFDPERTRRSIEAVGELSRTHQVLLFTCHPHLVRIVEEILPPARLYPLQ